MPGRVPAGLHLQSGAQRAGPGRPRLPNVVPQHAWQHVVQAPIPNGQAQTTVSSAGTAQVQAGPSGIGTVWYPARAVITTTTGTGDVSRCFLYMGTVSQQTQIGDASYRGGGDSVPLGGYRLQPGDLIVALWEFARPGDTATLALIGDGEALAW